MKDNTGRKLSTVSTAVRVLEALRDLGGAGVTELANHLELSKAAVHGHLSTLRDEQLVVKYGDDYHLSYHFVTLGEYVKNQSNLYTAGKERVDGLAEDTGEFAHLMTEQFGYGVHLYKAQGDQAVGEPYHVRNLQRRDYLHYSAAGKAILSRLPTERIRSIIAERGLPQRTESTITSESELLDQLDTIRKRGYAFNDEEEIDGLRAVAAPIDTDSLDTVGAVSLSAPISRFNGQYYRDEIPEMLMHAANLIELDIETTNK